MKPFWQVAILREIAPFLVKDGWATIRPQCAFWFFQTLGQVLIRLDFPSANSNQSTVLEAERLRELD